jgi:hypothetical protein
MDQGNFGDKMDIGILDNLHMIPYMVQELFIVKLMLEFKKGYSIMDNLKEFFMRNHDQYMIIFCHQL